MCLSWKSEAGNIFTNILTFAIRPQVKPLSLYRYITYIPSGPVLNLHFMFKEKIYPYMLVGIQLSSLTYLLVSGPIFAHSWDGLLLETAGVFFYIKKKVKNCQC